MKNVKDEVGHWWNVASAFKPWQHEFWLGLFHDTVEDGYLPKWLLRLWHSLDSITRREGEPYAAYISRVGIDRAARRVKLADLQHNLTRNGGPPRQSLRDRYLSALDKLEKMEAQG